MPSLSAQPPRITTTVTPASTQVSNPSPIQPRSIESPHATLSPLPPYLYFLKNPLNCCHLGSLFLFGSLVANAMYQHRVISSEIPMMARISVTSGRASACTLRSASGVVMGARNSKRAMGARLTMMCYPRKYGWHGRRRVESNVSFALGWARRWMRCEVEVVMTACCPKERMRSVCSLVLKLHYQSGCMIEEKSPRECTGGCRERERQQAAWNVARVAAAGHLKLSRNPPARTRCQVANRNCLKSGVTHPFPIPERARSEVRCFTRRCCETRLREAYKGSAQEAPSTHTGFQVRSVREELSARVFVTSRTRETPKTNRSCATDMATWLRYQNIGASTVNIQGGMYSTHATHLLLIGVIVHLCPSL
jgi:hypothetical protein